MKLKYSFLKIYTGSDLSIRRLPLMKVKSEVQGPVVWLTACVHGDEVGGMVIIQEIFKKLRKQHLKKGVIYAFPLMNPGGFEVASRNVTLSNEDLNRSFPGNPTGTLAERIANTIFTTIVRTKPELVLDLHNDWKKSIPYSLLDPMPETGDNKVMELTKTYIERSGFLFIQDTEILKKSLSHNLIQQGFPAITMELGESYIVNEKNIDYGVKSIWNLLSHLGMADPDTEEFIYPLKAEYKQQSLTYSQKPFCSKSGIIRFLVKPGDKVNKNQQVGRIYNTFGKHLETITALEDGIVLGHSDFSLTYPGASVMAFGNFFATMEGL